MLSRSTSKNTGIKKSYYKKISTHALLNERDMDLFWGR